MFIPGISQADKVSTADLDFDRGATAEGDAAVAPRPSRYRKSSIKPHARAGTGG